MIISVWLGTGILAAAIFVGLIRLFTAKEPATKAAVGDIIFFSCVGILILQGMLHRSAVSVDLGMIASILGILATIALARIVTRGRR